MRGFPHVTSVNAEGAATRCMCCCRYRLKGQEEFLVASGLVHAFDAVDTGDFADIG
jgi:hypothetical protein